MSRHAFSLSLALLTPAWAAPVLLDDQFFLPPGFHIYKAADQSLTGGSYDIALDQEARLLVGDGKAIRRLTGADDDGVYDAYETIAEGLGPRGPQGLLVDGDNLYAVGGDGVQRYTGYLTHETPLPQGRIGQPFRTGGDHDAHSLLRGHDGWIYLISGDGGGIENRKHITEPHSAAMFERSASVFRFDPSGERWECVSTGGRNPPNLGMNELGELFSLDSDMEWHVDVPWYRPVRLNAWLIGGDNGWKSVGAYPPYYIDNAPGILDVGRGSPNWGVFYEANVFPERYHGAYLVADYRWKSATQGDYNTSGRLLAFHMRRDGAWWKAEISELAKARPDAKDEKGQPISFAIVDVEVAPDGSLLISDHNQGVWRLFYNPPGTFQTGQIGLFGADGEWPDFNADSALHYLLVMAQFSAPWSQSQASTLIEEYQLKDRILEAALDSKRPVRERLQAARICAPDFEKLPGEFLARLAASEPPELRGYAAWLIGLRRNEAEADLLGRLLADREPHVRRRAAEAANRHPSEALTPKLLAMLDDPERIARYCAMTALSHRSPAKWMAEALKGNNPEVIKRALVAAHLRREEVKPGWLAAGLTRLLTTPAGSVESALDTMRLVELFHDPIAQVPELTDSIREFLDSLPVADREIRWEQARLFGHHGLRSALPTLIERLQAEPDHVTQFHLAQAISRIPSDGSKEASLVDWLARSQRGWFADLQGKGLEFPHFWATVLAEFAEHHGENLLQAKDRLEPGSQLSEALYPLLLKQGDDATLRRHFKAADTWEKRRRVLGFLGQARTPDMAVFLAKQLEDTKEQAPRDELWKALANMPLDSGTLLLRGLAEANDAEAAGRLISRVTRDGLKPESIDDPRKVYQRLLHWLGREAKLTSPVDRCLQKLTGEQSGVSGKGAMTEDGRKQLANFWAGWYLKRFGEPFENASAKGMAEREAHALLLKCLAGSGDAAKGQEVYTKTGCFACHGGLPGKNAVLFGPDLAGVTSRLSANEIADAVVYPSKQVADRFKATVVELTNGESLAGFITEQSAGSVTLTVNTSARKLARSEIAKIAPQETSLMPANLLGGLTEDEVKDLAAFLKSLR